MDTMTTVSEVLNHLKLKGYTVDFNIDNDSLVSNEHSLRIHPDEFVVDKHYRFEGMSDPADEAIIYAISSIKHNIKGTLVDGYGVSSDKLTNDMIQALKVREPSDHIFSESKQLNDKSNESED